MLQNVEHCNCRKIQYKNYSILGSGVPGNRVTLTTVEGTVIPSPSSHLLPAEGILNRAIKYGCREHAMVSSNTAIVPIERDEQLVFAASFLAGPWLTGSIVRGQ
jgi:hypothetical protein